jgi:hypothetical protein
VKFGVQTPIPPKKKKKRKVFYHGWEYTLVIALPCMHKALLKEKEKDKTEMCFLFSPSLPRSTTLLKYHYVLNGFLT